MTQEDVLSRLGRGDRLEITSSFSFQSRFNDGTVVSHQTMQILLDANKVTLPEQRGRGAAWILR
jgi:hypothetical protein